MFATNSASWSGGITQYSILRLVMPFFLASCEPSRDKSTPPLPTPPVRRPTAAATTDHTPPAAFRAASRSTSLRLRRPACSASGASPVSCVPTRLQSPRSPVAHADFPPFGPSNQAPPRSSHQATLGHPHLPEAVSEP